MNSLGYQFPVRATVKVRCPECHRVWMSDSIEETGCVTLSSPDCRVCGEPGVIVDA